VSELHKFLFEKIRVRGAIVRLDDAWVEILRRRASNTSTGAYPAPVQELLGEMVAAGVLMQSGIKFDGALILQIQGDGPVKLAVAEVQADLSLRATATFPQALSEGIKFSEMCHHARSQNAVSRAAGVPRHRGLVWRQKGEAGAGE
jgi:molecular chaperone Hsp33